MFEKAIMSFPLTCQTLASYSCKRSETKSTNSTIQRVRRWLARDTVMLAGVDIAGNKGSIPKSRI